MRHVAKTHRVNLAWLSEIVNKALCTIMYLSTDRQAADILTKGFDKPKLFAYLRLLIGIHDPHDPPDFVVKFSESSNESHFIQASSRGQLLPSCCVVTAMPPPGSACGRGAKAQPSDAESRTYEDEDGLEVGHLDWWKVAAREFIRSSTNIEGDTQAKTDIFEYLADSTVSFRSMSEVVLSIMKITGRFGSTRRMLQDALSGKKFPPIHLPERIEIILLSDSSMSIGKKDTSKVSFGEIIGNALQWDRDGLENAEVWFYQSSKLASSD